MVIAKASSAEIKNKAIALKMHTLFDDGLMKVKEGFTTIEEVLRVTQEE
jgi:type II secretory ATPase GspE/PulE/Tfp pilus assembly ATPase PilB-like protein